MFNKKSNQYFLSLFSQIFSYGLTGLIGHTTFHRIYVF